LAERKKEETQPSGMSRRVVCLFQMSAEPQRGEQSFALEPQQLLVGDNPGGVRPPSTLALLGLDAAVAAPLAYSERCCCGDVALR